MKPLVTTQFQNISKNVCYRSERGTTIAPMREFIDRTQARVYESYAMALKIRSFSGGKKRKPSRE